MDVQNDRFTLVQAMCFVQYLYIDPETFMRMVNKCRGMMKDMKPYTFHSFNLPMNLLHILIRKLFVIS